MTASGEVEAHEEILALVTDRTERTIDTIKTYDGLHLNGTDRERDMIGTEKAFDHLHQIVTDLQRVMFKVMKGRQEDHWIPWTHLKSLCRRKGELQYRKIGGQGVDH